MENLLDMTISEMRALLKKREITAVELASFYLKRIERYDNDVMAYLNVTEDKAHEMARIADRKMEQGEDIPFGHTIWY